MSKENNKQNETIIYIILIVFVLLSSVFLLTLYRQDKQIKILKDVNERLCDSNYNLRNDMNAMTGTINAYRIHFNLMEIPMPYNMSLGRCH